MWKYVSRRIRDTFERSVNHFDKRSTTGIVNSAGNAADDKNQRASHPCPWFHSRSCWKNTNQGYNDTNSKRWNFDQLNCAWLNAITWSSALVVGWYTSQIIHLRLKYHCKKSQRRCVSVNALCSSLQPFVGYVNKNPVYLNSFCKLEKIIGIFAPTVYLVSNGDGKNRNGTDSATNTNSKSDISTTPDTSDDDLGDVLNSIENKLGLAAIENGQHQDGLNLLRSAANRNHAPALYNLGLCYEMGLGVPIDEKAAMELYRSAAALQHPGALYNLGIYYGQGRGGLSRDLYTATRLLRLAAVQGQEDAISALKIINIHDIEPSRSATDVDWFNRFTLYSQNDNIVPTQTSLFVENVNYSQYRSCFAEVY